MEDVAIVLPGLLCGGGMALMTWLMTRNKSGPRGVDRDRPGWPRSSNEQLRLLRAEITRLWAERASAPEDQPTPGSTD